MENNEDKKQEEFEEMNPRAKNRIYPKENLSADEYREKYGIPCAGRYCDKKILEGSREDYFLGRDPDRCNHYCRECFISLRMWIRNRQIDHELLTQEIKELVEFLVNQFLHEQVDKQAIKRKGMIKLSFKTDKETGEKLPNGKSYSLDKWFKEVKGGRNENNGNGK